MFEKFNAQARQAVVHAQEEAQRLNQHYIGTEHLLLGLLDVDGSVAAKALTALSISTDDVRRDVEEITGRGEEPPTAHIPFTPRSKQVLDLSVLEAMQLNHSSVGTAHILLGLLRERDGVAGRVLTARGIGLDQLRQHVTLLAGDPRTPAFTGHPEPRNGQETITAGETEQAAHAIEIRRLRAENERLRAILHDHGIDPGTGHAG